MHQPVLLAETVDLLSEALREGGVYVDVTLGLGGHAEAVLRACPAARLVGIDRDPAALAMAGARLGVFGERVVLREAAFGDLEQVLGELGISKVQAILADLGVSSLQLDDAERGFSFRFDARLDMRMGRNETGAQGLEGKQGSPELGGSGLTAAEVVNQYPEDALTRIFMEYGEENQARRVARGIVRARAEKPLETTTELARLIEKLKPEYPARPREGKKRIHPATQVFQALRIEVNQELDQLKELLDQSVRLLEHQGRLVVISYHSLEDRMVKHTLREMATGEIEPVTGRPLAETQIIEVLTKRPVRPLEAEVNANPRARSARLRAARRL